MHPDAARYKSAWRRVKFGVGGVPRTPREAVDSMVALSTLRAQGWQRSLGDRPRDRRGDPVPWMSYSVVRFLDRLDLSNRRVLEFGAGASTAWLAGRCAEVLSIEHDHDWASRLTQPVNGRIALAQCTGDWWKIKTSDEYLRIGLASAPWDLVIIDGMGRVTCAENADALCAPDGLVVLDDTHGDRNLAGRIALAEQGFGRIDFWGFKPGIGVDTCTSVFCRNFNAWLPPIKY